MDESSIRENRKDEHVQLALTAEKAARSDFDDLTFIHRSLPETNLDEIDVTAKVGNLQWDSPLYINAMTGGSVNTGAINAQLAEAAAKTGIAIAVGSQHSGLRKASLADTYKVVRKKNPAGIVFSNVGADVSTDFALRAIDMLEADALQIHLNVPQEVVMPEGERQFSGMLGKIETLLTKTSIPVIVKETGFGMSFETLSQLQRIGVRYVDVSGRGGTNFITIENERRAEKDFRYLNGWGQSTPVSLLEAQPFLQDMTILASGGIRNPLDAAKSLALGAAAAGVAGSFLKILHTKGTDGLIKEINRWKTHLKMIFLMQGTRSIQDMQRNPIMVTGSLREWCELRGIYPEKLARRKKI